MWQMAVTAALIVLGCGYLAARWTDGSKRLSQVSSQSRWTRQTSKGRTRTLNSTPYPHPIPDWSAGFLEFLEAKVSFLCAERCVPGWAKKEKAKTRWFRTYTVIKKRYKNTEAQIEESVCGGSERKNSYWSQLANVRVISPNSVREQFLSCPISATLFQCACFTRKIRRTRQSKRKAKLEKTQPGLYVWHSLYIPISSLECSRSIEDDPSRVHCCILKLFAFFFVYKHRAIGHDTEGSTFLPCKRDLTKEQKHLPADLQLTRIALGNFYFRELVHSEP